MTPHHKKALLLSYFGLSYNLIEGVLSVFLGAVSNSISLIGFGLDSFVESLSGMVMIWRFGSQKSLTHKEEEKIEEKATKLVGYTFFALAVYVLYESVSKLYFGRPSDPSFFGIIITLFSLMVMPFLYFEKKKISVTINSRSLAADAKQTLACMFLSISVLTGLALNYFFGFWQADPIVGILVSVMLLREGVLAIREARLCGC